MEDKTENTDLAKWIENSLSEDELKELGKEYDLNKLKNSFERMKNYAFKKGNPQKAWENLEIKLAEHKKTKKHNIIPIFLKIAVAVIIVFFASYWLITDNSVTIKTEFAQIKDIYLPDSSLIKLNAGSEIKYNPDKWNKNRTVSLKGEAYFEVKKGNKFIVKTNVAQLEVVGTSFNIKNRGTNYSAQCFSGIVKVKYAGKEETIRKGNAVRIYKNSLIKYDFQNSNADWLQNRLIFKDTKLADVFQELQINYNFVFKLKQNEIAEKVFSGQVPKDNLKGAVTIICKAMDLEYEIDTAKKIVLIYLYE